MKYNAYPSQVFVGDTYCYFAGIVLALSAIFGNTLHNFSIGLNWSPFTIHSSAH